MSRPLKPTIYTPQNTYTDRAKKVTEEFAELTTKIKTLDTALLLIKSEEEEVLIAVLKHITEFVRQREENIAVVKEKNLLDVLLEKELFIESKNNLIRRFALYLTTAILESINILQDIDAIKVQHIQSICESSYLKETDDFCLEYLSVCINKYLEDPQAALAIVNNIDFMARYFAVVAKTSNPDVILHSIEALQKILQVQSTQVLKDIIADKSFPINRILCELTSEFLEIRTAALKVTRILIADISETSPFTARSRAVNVLQQLTKVFCDDALAPNAADIVDVLSTAMITEHMTRLFFEENLFDKIVQNLEANAEEYSLQAKCQIMRIFAEAAKYPQFLSRLHNAHITQQFLKCLVEEESPSTHVITGLNRLIKHALAANAIADFEGVIPSLKGIMLDRVTSLKSREQAAELVSNLLTFAFNRTATELIAVNVANGLAEIFSEGLEQLSIDFILSLLDIIEKLAQNSEYREYLGESAPLTQHLATLLRNSFSAAIVVTNIFRCLSTLIEEESVRHTLLCRNIGASIKRGLKSISNSVRTAVTNFIMQTARFPEFINEYLNANVLEVLILFQKHAFCVPTWGPAIEAILSKVPSLKFCIRNHLSFTDITGNREFLVSKRKFQDFRTFQSILREEVSPLHPILVVNFNRPETSPDQVVKVPEACLRPEDGNPECWCFCRSPADPYLPVLLEQLNTEIQNQGLMTNPSKVKRSIDFDIIAKRAKIIANFVANALSTGLATLDLNAPEECSLDAVKCHYRELVAVLHCTIIPLGALRTGCQFERAVLFKALADQIGLPCTLQRGVSGNLLYNELPLPVEIEHDTHCDKRTLEFMPWRMLRPTHVVDLVYNVGELYPLQSRQALQYLRMC